jgi:2,4-dienoyl-CoA reductase-like NADH-dependent reductase (Old Yellow Enzyme family)
LIDFSSLDTIRELAKDVGVEMGFREDISPLWEPATLGGLYLPNRVAIQPLEGADAGIDGAPTQDTMERYLRWAQGGAGLIWFEATSVDFPEARTHDSMLVISEDNLPRFKELVEGVKERSREKLEEAGFQGRAALVLQLSHAGRFRKERSERSPVLAQRVEALDELSGLSIDEGRVISDDELIWLTEAYVEASALAQMAGFDGVDVKACHGYLLNELLAAYTREGDYGGESLMDRGRFLLETMARVKEETDMEVTSRLSAYDGLPYPYGFGGTRNGGDGLPGFDPGEPVRLLREMRLLGVDLVNISMGNPYVSPFVSRPFATEEMGGGVEHPLKGVERHFKVVETLKERVPGLSFVGSGYSWLRGYGFNAAAHNLTEGDVDVAGWGRLAIAHPGFPLEGHREGCIPPEKACVACSGCIRLLRSERRVGCVVHDPEARERLTQLKSGG